MTYIYIYIFLLLNKKTFKNVKKNFFSQKVHTIISLNKFSNGNNKIKEMSIFFIIM